MVANTIEFERFSLNGKVSPISKATISVFNIEYSYGFGVYETIRVVSGVVYFLKEHIERLLKSARIIGLEHDYSEEDIARYVSNLVKQLRVSVGAYNLKILLIGNKNRSESLLYILPLHPLFLDRKMYRDGVSVISANYERLYPNAKTLSMLHSYLAFKKAKENNCYDALAVDRDNYIIEGTRTNFFLMKDKTIFTPTRNKILEGITMKILLYLSDRNGFSIKEKNVRFAELSEYDGAFLTSTSSKVLPIRRIDDHQFSLIPESIRVLGELYDNYLSKCKGIFAEDEKQERC